MSKKVLAEKVQRGGSLLLRRPASQSTLAALFGAWLHSVAVRPDQRLGWQDAGIGLGLAILWLLARAERS